MQKREQENQKEISSKTDIGWGHQIQFICFAAVSACKRFAK